MGGNAVRSCDLTVNRQKIDRIRSAIWTM